VVYSKACSKSRQSKDTSYNENIGLCAHSIDVILGSTVNTNMGSSGNLKRMWIYTKTLLQLLHLNSKYGIWMIVSVIHNGYTNEIIMGGAIMWGMREETHLDTNILVLYNHINLAYNMINSLNYSMNVELKQSAIN
jgi:hypothetical protein